MDWLKLPTQSSRAHRLCGCLEKKSKLILGLSLPLNVAKENTLTVLNCLHQRQTELCDSGLCVKASESGWLPIGHSWARPHRCSTLTWWAPPAGMELGTKRNRKLKKEKNLFDIIWYQKSLVRIHWCSCLPNYAFKTSATERVQLISDIKLQSRSNT